MHRTAQWTPSLCLRVTVTERSLPMASDGSLLTSLVVQGWDHSTWNVVLPDGPGGGEWGSNKKGDPQKAPPPRSCLQGSNPRSQLLCSWAGSSGPDFLAVLNLDTKSLSLWLNFFLRVSWVWG